MQQRGGDQAELEFGVPDLPLGGGGEREREGGGEVLRREVSDAESAAVLGQLGEEAVEVLGPCDGAIAVAAV